MKSIKALLNGFFSTAKASTADLNCPVSGYYAGSPNGIQRV